MTVSKTTSRNLFKDRKKFKLLNDLSRNMFVTMIIVSNLHFIIFLVDVVFNKECEDYDVFVEAKKSPPVTSGNSFGREIHNLNTKGSSTCFTIDVYRDFSGEIFNLVERLADSAHYIFTFNIISRILYWIDLSGVILLSVISVLVGIRSVIIELKIINSADFNHLNDDVPQDRLLSQCI